MRLILFVLALLPLFTLSACKSSCRALADMQCECLETQYERDYCYQLNSYNEGGEGQPTAEDLAVCDALLETCQCGVTDTAEGKEACGLARRPSPP